MKAIVYNKYGNAEVLALKEMEPPLIKANELVVQMVSASLNPLDMHIMHGMLPVRPIWGLFSPRYKILGADIAGVVVKVGADVSGFKEGDEVFGVSSVKNKLGGFAEFVSVKEDEIVLKPANLTMDEVAAAPIAAVTALQGLRDVGQIKANQRVLINGASGGVGTYAVQLAKHYGAEVTAVCSQRNHAMVKSLGADYTLDYSVHDFTQQEKKYDLVLDNVGNRNLADSQNAITAKGIFVSVGFTSLSNMFGFMLKSPWLNKKGTKTLKMVSSLVNTKDLLFLADLLSSGKIVSVIDQKFAFVDTPKAMSYLESRRARGKVIIAMPGKNS